MIYDFRKVRQLPAVVLLSFGVGMICVNIYGLSDDLYSAGDCRGSQAMETCIGYSDTIDAIAQVDEQNAGEIELASALNRIVHDRLIHYSGDALRVSLYDNWIIWAWFYLWPSRYSTQYEFVDPKRSLRRGLGLCGQQALTLVGLLDERGYTVGRVRLRGHMTAWIQLRDDRAFIIDPDYGVYFSFDIESVTADPTVIADTYTNVGTPSEIVSKLNEIYAPPNKLVGPGLWRSTGWWTAFMEEILYGLKWLLPLVSLAFGLLLLCGGCAGIARRHALI